LLLASCSPVETGSNEDFIGPAPQRALVQETTRAEALRQVNAATEPATQPSGPIQVTLSQAVLMALENNRAFVVQRYNPPLERTLVEQQLAAFDPNFGGSFTFERLSTTAQNLTLGKTFSQSYTPQLALSEFLPTGTTLALMGQTTINEFPGIPQDKFATTAGFSATQSLLRGFGPDVNYVSLRQARLDVLNSQYQLRGFAESLVASTEEAYWNYALAQRQIEIVIQSLGLAQKQLDDTLERIRVGTVAQTEQAAAEAEVASRHEALIDARSAADKALITLLRLLSPGGTTFDREITLLDTPAVPAVELNDPDPYVQVGLKLRPDLNEAKLQVNRGDLQIVKTKNGLLPQLDLFANLSRTGYADSFGASVTNLKSPNYTFLAGATFSLPPLNRLARAEYTNSVLARDQAMMAVSNMAQLVESDVRTAFIEARRTQEQVTATAATSRLQQETVRAEMERFQVGKSTSLLVSLAQRDLLSAQIAEVQAVVAYTNSLVELYRLNGSLLLRRNIASPGDKAVEINAADLRKYNPPPAP
jgi:outer membrane protein TolC